MTLRGNNVFAKSGLRKFQAQDNAVVNIRDLFLHALFARFALTNNQTVEFRTVFNKATNTIELDVPEAFLSMLDELTGMQKGPKFQAYIDWLIGRQSIIDSIPTSVDSIGLDKNFIPASAFNIWTGAIVVNQLDDKLVLIMPGSSLAVVGYNSKIGDNVTSVTIVLVWVYDSGLANAGSFVEIQTTASIGEIDGNSVGSFSTTTEISTTNLIQGDIRETMLCTLNVQANDMLSLVFRRGFFGNVDPTTELIGILGIRLIFNQ